MRKYALFNAFCIVFCTMCGAFSSYFTSMDDTLRHDAYNNAKEYVLSNFGTGTIVYEYTYIKLNQKIIAEFNYIFPRELCT